MTLAELHDALYRQYREILTAKQFEALYLSEVEGLYGKEIAYRMGISRSAVSRHLMNAKEKIRKRIQEGRESS